MKHMVTGGEEQKKVLSQLIKSVMNEGSERKIEDNSDKDKLKS